MKEEKRQQAKDALFGQLRKEGFEERENGMFTYPIYACRDDSLPEQKLGEILDSDDPEMSFCTAVEEAYDPYHYGAHEAGIVDRAVQGSCPADRNEEEEVRVYLSDLFCEVVEYDYPYDHFKKQSVRADILVDTGDANFDFALNTDIYPHYEDMKGAEIEDRASLVWLAKTQGYTKAQLQHALDKGDVMDPENFLESVRQEVAGETTCMNSLTFLAEMTVQELLDINKLMRRQMPEGEYVPDAERRPDCGTVRLSRKAAAGMFDDDHGGGSGLGLMLEKDVDLPVRYIFACRPDDCMKNPIRDTYGLCGSAWRTVVKEIRAPQEQEVAG